MEGMRIPLTAQKMFKVELLFAKIHLEFPLSTMFFPFSPSQVTEGFLKMFSFQKYFSD